jgi:hypothetical protein
MCGGLAYSATEQTTVLANPASGEASWRVLCASRSGFGGRGWRRGCSFEGHPHEDSMVPLTLGRTRHNGWCGSVPLPRASTTSSMVMQWPGWSHRADGDGGDRSGASLTSRRHPVRARSSRASSLRGFRRPFSSVRCAGRMGVEGRVPRGGC